MVESYIPHPAVLKSKRTYRPSSTCSALSTAAETKTSTPARSWKQERLGKTTCFLNTTLESVAEKQSQENNVGVSNIKISCLGESKSDDKLDQALVLAKKRFLEPGKQITKSSPVSLTPKNLSQAEDDRTILMRQFDFRKQSRVAAFEEQVKINEGQSSVHGNGLFAHCLGLTSPPRIPILKSRSTMSGYLAGVTLDSDGRVSPTFPSFLDASKSGASSEKLNSFETVDLLLGSDSELDESDALAGRSTHRISLLSQLSNLSKKEPESELTPPEGKPALHSQLQQLKARMQQYECQKRRLHQRSYKKRSSSFGLAEEDLQLNRRSKMKLLNSVELEATLHRLTPLKKGAVKEVVQENSRATTGDLRVLFEKPKNDKRPKNRDISAVREQKQRDSELWQKETVEDSLQNKSMTTCQTVPNHPHEDQGLSILKDLFLKQSHGAERKKHPTCKSLVTFKPDVVRPVFSDEMRTKAAAKRPAATSLFHAKKTTLEVEFESHVTRRFGEEIRSSSIQNSEVHRAAVEPAHKKPDVLDMMIDHLDSVSSNLLLPNANGGEREKQWRQSSDVTCSEVEQTMSTVVRTEGHLDPIDSPTVFVASSASYKSLGSSSDLSSVKMQETSSSVPVSSITECEDEAKHKTPSNPSIEKCSAKTSSYCHHVPARGVENYEKDLQLKHSESENGKDQLQDAVFVKQKEKMLATAKILSKKSSHAAELQTVCGWIKRCFFVLFTLCVILTAVVIEESSAGRLVVQYVGIPDASEHGDCLEATDYVFPS